MGAKTLEKQEYTENALLPDQVKVKISYVLLSNHDALLWNGDIKTTYPKVIGRTAIGIVTEVGENCYGIKKDDKVYLKATLPCRKCYSCKTGNTAKCENIQVATRDFDGFMRDFAVCNYSDVTVLPDGFDEFTSLSIEAVALAENIYSKLNLSVGNTVAIIGAGFLGNILAQIAIYHKFVPIVIDNYNENLETIKRCGTFHAFNADDELEEKLMQATSGKMCDAAIYTNNSKMNTAIPARVVAKKKNIVFGGLTPLMMPVDALPAFAKNAMLFSITDGYQFIDSAINTILHGAIDLSGISKTTLSTFDLQELLAEKCNNVAKANSMTVLKLII